LKVSGIGLAVTEMAAVCFSQIFAGKFSVSGDVATTDTLEIAEVLHTSVVFDAVNAAVTV
jgi:hypothetical protein